MRAAIVLNPAAGGGRMRRDWPAIAEALTARLGAMPVVETRRPGEGGALARNLAAGGAELVIAAGGDGTVSEVADGLMRAGRDGRAGAALGVVPVGTGDDFWRGLGLSRDPAQLAGRIADGPGRTIDVGRVSFSDGQAGVQSRHFVNVASLGVSGETARAVNAAKRRGGGRSAFLRHAVVELLRARFAEVTIRIDGGEPIRERVALVAVANGRFFGGGMMIAPDAGLDDGLLDVVVVRGRSKLALLADLRLVYSGAHRRLESCLFLRGRSVRIEPAGAGGAPVLEIDGESPGRAPATFELLPRALTVRG